VKIAGFSASDKQRDKRNSADEYPKRYSAYQGLGHMSYASSYYMPKRWSTSVGCDQK